MRDDVIVKTQLLCKRWQIHRNVGELTPAANFKIVRSFAMGYLQSTVVSWQKQLAGQLKSIWHLSAPFVTNCSEPETVTGYCARRLGANLCIGICSAGGRSRADVLASEAVHSELRWSPRVALQASTPAIPKTET